MDTGVKRSAGGLLVGLAVVVGRIVLSPFPLAAQQGNLEVLREILQVENVLVFQADTVIRGEPSGPSEAVVFVNCNGALDRAVNGSVVILNGELGLRRGARVAGDVFLVRSTLFSSRGAEITGQTLNNSSADAVRAVNTVLEGRNNTGGSFPIHLKMETNRMGGFKIKGYDRVDGFSVSWGFDMIHPDWDGYKVLSAKVISATSRQAIGFDTRFSLPLDSEKHWISWAGARSLTDTNDRWRLGDLENAVKAFVAGYDHRYYFRREGFSAGVTRLFGRHCHIGISYLNEQYYSMTNHSPFTLAGEENFEPNLPVSGGPLHSIQLEAVLDSRNDPYFTLSGTRFSFTGELAGGVLGGEHGFARYDLSLERWDTFAIKHHSYLWLKWAGADVSLPFQRGYTLGNTLRGHDNFAYSGDRMLLGQAAYSYSLPTLPVVEYLFFRWQADLIYEAGTAFSHGDPLEGYGDLKHDTGIGFTGNTILGRVGLHLFQDLDKSIHSGRRITVTLDMNVYK
ncbi:hypothetical protein ACFL4X_01850 [Gemmatimonadota bacterium]